MIANMLKVYAHTIGSGGAHPASLTIYFKLNTDDFKKGGYFIYRSFNKDTYCDIFKLFYYIIIMIIITLW